jgi:cell division protease FtsH
MIFRFIFNFKKISGLEDEIIVNKSNKKSNEELETIDNFVGCNNIKKDINELITQIKYHQVFSYNDCNLPKGVLLLGPPGCGKTHLVKTIINATKINYIFSSGSDFNKVYVGSGTLMLNEIFKKAKENKPCLIFIDEADALIKKRTFSDSSAVSTEFGSSLCKLLAELDSIKTEAGIVVIFATNMNEKFIDAALMRAGRVDKILHITEPTFEERKQLFKMYLKDLYNKNTIDLEIISKLSSGLTGSDIKKIVNSLKISKVNEYITEVDDVIKETKIFSDKIKISFNKIMKFMNFDPHNIQVQHKLEYNVNTKEIDKEINKCIMGLERERPINFLNKKLIAYHEAGHAIMSFLLKDTNLPTKICISITSKTLGYTMYLNDDEDIIMNTSINNLMRQIMILYSGRASEKIFLNEITCGAEDDYLKARKILKRLLLNGMLIPKINLITDKDDDKIPEYVEVILTEINDFLLNKINSALNENKEIVFQTAELIILNNSITGDDIKDIFIKNNLENKIGSINIIDLLEELKININIK